MMLYPSMSLLLEKVNSRYMLVNVLAYRAREISQKAEENDEPLSKKAVSLAIDELANGDLKIKGKE
ncbi:MAG: DNA-directed RNA polymerase subunit omega [Oscillospiraceae bacterium]|nr:DNA-directed RNA polymerase subunit omega [Oscillospiraceae bacterium]